MGTNYASKNVNFFKTIHLYCIYKKNVLYKFIKFNFIYDYKNYKNTHCQVQVKLSFMVIPLHVGTYSGTKCRASQDHGAT